MPPLSATGYKGVTFNAKVSKYHCKVWVKREAERQLLPDRIRVISYVSGGYWVSAEDAARASDRCVRSNPHLATYSYAPYYTLVAASRHDLEGGMACKAPSPSSFKLRPWAEGLARSMLPLPFPLPFKA